MSGNSPPSKRSILALKLKAKASGLGSLYDWLRRGKAFARYRVSKPHDPDFAAFALLPGDGLFLDIGASIGQSALSFRIYNKRSPIISFEPLPGHRGDLEFIGRVLDDHSFEMFGASDETGPMTLYVPAIGSYRLTAESALDRGDVTPVIDRLKSEGHDPGNLKIEKVEVQLRKLDELDLDPQFVKIDVEGAELRVLKGMEQTIARNHPSLMIEKSDDEPAVAEFLSGYGYESKLYDAENRRFVNYTGQDCWNVFYL